MTPERWEQIKIVFEAVDAAEPGDQSALLARLCGGDARLREEIEQLLSDTGEEGPIQGVVKALAAEFALAPGELAGKKLGPYRVDRLIGSGGAGEVYAATDVRLGRPVALKVLLALHSRSPEQIRRFHVEARAASALNHPNIVTVYDFGQDGDLFYIATELVEGQTLRRVMANGRPPIGRVVDIGTQLASALAAAHEAGIIHRDIKPENVMVRSDGIVKILDFGLAKLRDISTASGSLKVTLTATGTVLGTTDYMSPEQARGVAVDTRSDVFSLGVVLYELACGEKPFQGDTHADLLAAILGKEPRPLRERAPEAPESFVSAVERCLRKDPQQRYAGCRPLLMDLQRAQLPVRRARWRGWLAAVGIVVFLVLGGLWWVRRSEPHWYEATRLRTVPAGEHAGWGLISPSGRFVVYEVDYPDGTQSLRVRALSATSSVEVLPPARVRHETVRVSPDENYVYFTAGRTLFRVPILGGSLQKILEDVHGLAMAPNGGNIAVARSEGLWTADSDGSNPRRVIASSVFSAFSWSYDGGEILYAEGGSLNVISPEGGAPRRLLDIGKLQIQSLAPLPDGSGYLLVASDSENTKPQIKRLTRGGLVTPITNDLSEYDGLSLTADGRLLSSNRVRRDVHDLVLIEDVR